MSEEKTKTAKKPTATVKKTFKKGDPAEMAAAPVKKPAAKKPAAKPAAAKKAEVKKVSTTAVPVAEHIEEKKEVKEMATKTTKTAATKTTATAAKKPAAKPAVKKAPAMKAEVVLQFEGNDYTEERLIQSAKDVWQYDLGKNVADIKTLQLYVKPEEKKVYGVVNDTDELSFNI